MEQKQIEVGLSLDQSGTRFASDPSTSSILSPTPRVTSPRTPITISQAIDTLQLRLTQANDIQHLFEKYRQQISSHTLIIASDLDTQFDQMIQELTKRKNTLKQKVEQWESDKLQSVTTEIDSAAQYESILNKAQKQCNQILKTQKTGHSQKLKQIKTNILSHLSKDQKSKFKIYNNSKALAQYINNITTTIDIKYPNTFPSLTEYGKFELNSNNSLSAIPTLKLLKPTKIRQSKNGFKIKLKWHTSQPLIDSKAIDRFVIRCLAKSDLENNKSKKMLISEEKSEEKSNPYLRAALNSENVWKSLIFKARHTNKEKTEFEAYDIDALFAFDTKYILRIEYHIANPVNLLIGSNDLEFEIENRPPDKDSKNELIELECVQCFGNSYEGHPKNLLSANDSEKYRSKPNNAFDYNEKDWIVFELKHSGDIRTYLPRMVRIKNTSGAQALRECRVSIGSDSDHTKSDKWCEYETIENVAQSSDGWQEFALSGVDWKVVKKLKTQFLKLELTENYGEARGKQCRFKVQGFQLFGVEFA